jgi:hypothetical protein
VLRIARKREDLYKQRRTASAELAVWNRAYDERSTEVSEHEAALAASQSSKLQALGKVFSIRDQINSQIETLDSKVLGSEVQGPNMSLAD